MISIEEVAPGTRPPPTIEAGVRRLLEEVDSEFVPALSRRSGTLSISDDGTGHDLASYMAALGFEWWLVALQDDAVVGLLSFLDDHDDAALAAFSSSLHVTTVAVTHSARRTGVATALYDALDLVAIDRRACVTTRTWTSNACHLRLLETRGFRRVGQIPEERGPGVGTVYFADCRGFT